MQDLNVQFNLPNTNLTLKGFSRAAVATGIYINELDIALDAGFRPTSNKIPSLVFITHTHADHVRICGDYSIESNNIRYLVHQDSLPFLKKFIVTSAQMNKNKYISDKYFNLIGLNKNDQINLKLNNNNYIIKTFDCNHNIPTLAYGFIEKRKKIKPEYMNLSKDEIIDLKKRNIDIIDEIEYPQFIFVGDTTIKFFEINFNILNQGYKSIIIECTYLYDDDYVKINQLDSKNKLKYMHIHWLDLKKYTIDNPQINFILIHFSTRYKDDEIREFFKKENLSNVTPFI